MLIIWLALLPACGQALRCYQGTTQHVHGVPAAPVPLHECPQASKACTKFVDDARKTVTRSCHMNECFFALAGGRAAREYCHNFTGHGNEMVCCCSGDACNAGAVATPKAFVLAAGTIVLVFAAR